MAKFLKWLALTSILAIVTIVVETKYQSLQLLAISDQSFLSYGIWVLTCFGIGYCLYCILTKQYRLKRVQEFVELCMRLGLLGTIIGLMMCIMSLDFSNESYKQEMTIGIVTSLASTITGLIGSLTLSVYVLFLKEYR